MKITKTMVEIHAVLSEHGELPISEIAEIYQKLTSTGVREVLKRLMLLNVVSVAKRNNPTGGKMSYYKITKPLDGYEVSKIIPALFLDKEVYAAIKSAGDRGLAFDELKFEVSETKLTSSLMRIEDSGRISMIDGRFYARKAQKSNATPINGGGQVEVIGNRRIYTNMADRKTARDTVGERAAPRSGGISSLAASEQAI